MKATQSMSTRNNFDSSKEQLDFSGSPIPIPQNFKCFQENQDLFIVNPKDGSIFKWVQVIGVLKPNGLTGKRKTEYGRRSFDGIFESKFDNNNYHETCDSKFKHCIKKYGGFYISVYKARYDENGKITYAGNGILVDRIKYDKARKIATRYMFNPDSTRDYTTDLPCGAAMDCISEYAFELLEKEVLEEMLPGERKADAWNRISKTKNFHQTGVYGIQDFFTGYAELTTEAYASAKYHVAVRNGSRGLFTICYNDYEKTLFETGRAIYFELGHRNFIAKEAEFIGFGFRLMLLPL
jgi:hypothetical protein